jgi:hypothetical protein
MNRAVVATAGAALGASFVLDPGAPLADAVVCPFRLVTGLPCPGCGLGHSFVAVAHGDLGAAFAFHPFGPLAFVACAGIVAIATFERFAGRPAVPNATATRFRSPAIAIVAAWLLWAVLRAVA